MSTERLIALAVQQYNILANPFVEDGLRSQASFAHDKNMQELDRRAAQGDAEAYDFMASEEYPAP